MIDGIHHRLFNSRQGEVPETLGFGPVRVLDHHLGQVAAPDVIHRITGYAAQRAAKFFFFKTVAARPIGKCWFGVTIFIPLHLEVR